MTYRLPLPWIKNTAPEETSFEAFYKALVESEAARKKARWGHRYITMIGEKTIIDLLVEIIKKVTVVSYNWVTGIASVPTKKTITSQSTPASNSQKTSQRTPQKTQTNRPSTQRPTNLPKSKSAPAAISNALPGSRKPAATGHSQNNNKPANNEKMPIQSPASTPKNTTNETAQHSESDDSTPKLTNPSEITPVIVQEHPEEKPSKAPAENEELKPSEVVTSDNQPQPQQHPTLPSERTDETQLVADSRDSLVPEIKGEVIDGGPKTGEEKSSTLGDLTGPQDRTHVVGLEVLQQQATSNDIIQPNSPGAARSPSPPPTSKTLEPKPAASHESVEDIFGSWTLLSGNFTDYELFAPKTGTVSDKTAEKLVQDQPTSSPPEDIVKPINNDQNSQLQDGRSDASDRETPPLDTTSQITTLPLTAPPATPKPKSILKIQGNSNADGTGKSKSTHFKTPSEKLKRKQTRKDQYDRQNKKAVDEFDSI